jgi:hypothetical protein
MNQKPSFSPFLTSATVALVCCVLVFSSGCRNCNPACAGNGYAYSPTIAPPPTYSLQIPSAGGNAAYYVPGSPNPNATANLPSYLVDPNRRAPVPQGTNGGVNINQQNGWRPTGNNNLSGTTSTTLPTTLAQNVGQRPGVFGNVPATQVASAPTAQSVVTSVDYASTRSNEQLDPTRLPATDASNVRAPAGFVNNGSATRLAQTRPATAPVYPNTFNQAVAFTQPAPAVYNGTPVIAQQPAQPFYYGTPTVRQSAPTVLAQSTATGVPSTGSAGWTDRELTASRNELNR